MDKWQQRFMDLARQVAKWSSCLRRQVGAVIVRDKRIITTGYNGAPMGVKTCVEKGECLREKLRIPSGTHAETCFAAHAEQNAIIQAAREGISLKGCTLFCTHQPCVVCAKMIINSGIREVIYDEGYPDEFSLQILNEAGVKLIKFDSLK